MPNLDQPASQYQHIMKILLGLVLLVATSLAMPEIGIETSREVSAQQLTPLVDSVHLPSVANSNAPETPVLTFFPEYNAYLVPAESLYPTGNVKRRRPMANLIKLIQQRRVQTQQVNGNITDSLCSNTNSETNISNQKPNANLRLPIKEAPIEKPKIHYLQTAPLQNIASENKGFIGQVGQLFQRPENLWPSNRPQFPLISSYLPPGLSGWRPFGNLFQQNSEAPRSHYVQYFTRTIPLQTEPYFYSGNPRSTNLPTYTEDIQDFVRRVQESVIKETSTDSDSSVMLANVPMGKNKPTSLLLRPVAKAVAGAKGVAVATPVAKAVLKKGESVDIDFDPDAVAIAGPGGQAHAHPKLIISYSNGTTY